jgi:hypothetical protein
MRVISVINSPWQHWGEWQTVARLLYQVMSFMQGECDSAVTEIVR